MTMTAVFQKPVIKTLINQIKIVNQDDLSIEYTDYGWRIRLKDPSNVAMLEISIPREAMESYEHDPNVAHTSIAFKKLVSVVNTLPDDGAVRVIDDGKGLLRVESGKYHGNIRVDGVFQELKVPDLGGDIMFEFDMAAIERMIGSASNTDAVSFKCDGTGLTVSTIGDDLEGMEYRDESIVHDGEPIAVMFPPDYMNAAMKGLRGPCIVELKSDYPMTVMINQPFTTKYMLAPRIENEE